MLGCFSYDPNTDTWTLLCLYASGMTLRLILFGRYDPKTDTWTLVAPISKPRDAVGVCLLGEKLYAVGGYDGQQYLREVECYDAQTNEWTQARVE